MDRLLSKTTDNSLLISRFQEFLEMDDVRFYVISSIRENVGKVMDKSKGVGELCWVLGSSVSCLMLSVSQSKCNLWMLACFAEYCLFGSFFSGSGARISEQCVHPHVQHQCAKPAVRADQLYGQTGRWDLLFDSAIVSFLPWCWAVAVWGEKAVLSLKWCICFQPNTRTGKQPNWM